nr:hypothetical protein [Tanacetum cinerariifolium]
MASLSSSSRQFNEVRTFNDNIFETVSDVPQDEHLDSDEDSVHEDNTIPYDHKVHTKVWKIKEFLTPFEEVIKKRTAPLSDVSYHREYNCIKKCFDEDVIPFFNNIKQLFQLLNHNIYMEVKEFKRIFGELDSEYEQTVLANKNLQIEKKNLLIKNEFLIFDSISKDICSIFLASVNIMPPISDCMCAELRTSCDREHNRVLELEAKISKLHNMLKESEKRYVFIQKDYIDLQVKFQNFKECDNSNATPSNAIFEINKLKDQLQERDKTIRNLESQFNILRMLKIGSLVGSLDKNALETEITQLKDNITSLRIQNDGTSPRSTQKPPVQHKKPTISVNMFPKAKPATEARKPIPKRNTQNHNPLPAKSVKARRAADYYRNLQSVL